MNAAALIADLARRGVILSSDGEGLSFDAPPGELTDADIALLRAGKVELMVYLSAAVAGQDPLALSPSDPLAAERWGPLAAGDGLDDHQDHPEPDEPGSWDLLDAIEGLGFVEVDPDDEPATISLSEIRKLIPTYAIPTASAARPVTAAAPVTQGRFPLGPPPAAFGKETTS